MAVKIKFTIKKITIIQKSYVKATVRSLGLGKLNSSVVHDDNSSIRGMIARCSHLLAVEEAK